jgi:peptide/nickel transport system substrate-binding protein
MRLARALAARSGTIGERVKVTVPRFQRDIGRYFTTLLARLGYRSSLHVLGNRAYFDLVTQPGSRVQFGFSGWSSDYLSPSTFIQPNFGCTNTLSHFCDRRLNRRIAGAIVARGAEAAASWAAIDRQITDLAPAVPLTNRRSIELVSARVGNVQHHVDGITLLEQLWVR